MTELDPFLPPAHQIKKGKGLAMPDYYNPFDVITAFRHSLNWSHFLKFLEILPADLAFIFLVWISQSVVKAMIKV